MATTKIGDKKDDDKVKNLSAQPAGDEYEEVMRAVKSRTICESLLATGMPPHTPRG